MKSELLQRIRQAKRYYGLTNGKIAETAGMTTATVTNQLQGKYKPDMDVVIAVLSLCPKMSAEWLMRGNGSMERSDELKRIADAIDELGKDVKSIYLQNTCK